MESSEPKKAIGRPNRTQSREGQYAKFEPLVDPAIARLTLMLQSRNDNAAISAIKTILGRTVPEIKAVEITGENGEAIKFNILAGATYFTALDKSSTASTDGTDYGLKKIDA